MKKGELCPDAALRVPHIPARTRARALTSPLARMLTSSNWRKHHAAKKRRRMLGITQPGMVDFGHIAAPVEPPLPGREESSELPPGDKPT